MTPAGKWQGRIQEGGRFKTMSELPGNVNEEQGVNHVLILLRSQ